MSKTIKRLSKLPDSIKSEVLKISVEDRDDYIRALRSKGWTLQSISDVFGVTRERVRQICESPTSDGNTERFFVPELPVREAKPRRQFAEPSEETLKRLLELQPLAQQVRSSSLRYRREAEEYTKLLHHAHTNEGVSIYRLGLRLGVTHSALRFRLARYGYMPLETMSGKTSKVYTPVKNRVI